jgi:hypothetical protein
MQVGFAKVSITPPLPVQLAGYGVERTGTRVADELHARAMVCEQDGRRVALLTADLLWLERRHLKVLRERVSEITGIAPDDLMVCASHTHSGPDTMDWFHFAPVDSQWLHALIAQLASAVFLAQQRLATATVELVQGELDIGINRRQFNSDRVVIGQNERGVYDRAFTGLRVKGEAGDLLASVVHYACHPVILGADNTRVSGDWPGWMCRIVEAELGGVCLFINGPAGDINPRLGCGRSYAEMVRVGQRAGGAAVELLSREAAAEGVGVAATSREVTVAHKEHPYLDVPLHRRLDEDGGMTVEVQALRLGPLSFISQPGEGLTETGRRILEQTRLTPAVVAGYTNDYVGYLPLPHIYEQGGYEPSATMLPAESVVQVADAAAAVADELVGDALPAA